MKRYWPTYWLAIAFAAAWANVAFAASSDPPNYDDPFYSQKGSNPIVGERRLSPFQQVQESVDPFTGNVNLLHTDVILPGNGGLDLKIQRSYNSRIWGRRDGVPTLVAASEASVMGIGWSFHFGRVRNPFGSGSSNRFVPDNPIVEMPDGSSQLLYQDKNNFSQLISREQWIYKQISNGVFQLTLTDGTVYTFPSTNAYFPATGVTVFQVSTIHTTNGNSIAFTYDPNDKRKVPSITDAVGRTITFSYQIIAVPPCPGGFQTTALTSMTVNGKVFTYSYQLIDCALFLTRATPPVGPSWNYTYIAPVGAGQYELRPLKYPSGAVFTYGYSDVTFDTGPSSIPFSVVTSRTLSGRGLNSTTWNYSYSANTPGSNQVTTITQAGCKTERYTYKSFGSLPDQQGTPVNQLWQIGSLLTKEILNGSTGVQTETYSWSPSVAISNDQVSNGNWGGLIGFLFDDHIFVPQLSSKTVTRDGKTYTTTYSNYNAYGDPGTITESGDASRTTTLTYFTDAVKNIVKNHPLSQAVTVGGETFTTNYSYDANGNLTTSNRYGVMTTFGYTNGNLTSRTNARGFTTNYQYSNGTVSQIAKPVAGNTITRVINQEGTIASETNGRGFTTAFAYDALNRVTLIEPPLETSTTVTYDNVGAASWRVDKGPTFTGFSVDGLGRVTSTSASGGINTSATYNVCGQKTYQSYPFVSSGPDIGDRFAYDSLDRVTQVTHPDLKTQAYSYANGNVAATNERGITVTYGYQAFGNPDEKRLTSVADAAGTTSYTYNAVSSLTSITHPGPLTRSFSYSTKNFLVGETHPETGSLTYGRDAVGNLTSKADGLGVTFYSYDALNLLTVIDYPGTAADTTFAYDNGDNRTSMSSPPVAFAYTYDGANRLTQQGETTGGTTYTTRYGYDGQGNVTNLTYPTGRVIAYTYDSANRVSSLTGYVSSVTYHPSGAMAGLTFANGKVTTIDHDNRYRVSTLRTPSVLSLTYSYDGVSNVTSIVDGLNGDRTRSMTYDNVDRLASASGIWGSMSFAYDALGNRTSKITSGGTTTYSYSSNRLATATGAEADTYAYDPNGNLTSIRGLALAYDFANRLTSVNGGTVAYTYDGDGKRVKKVNTATGKTVLYHYDRAGNILVETDGAGALQAEYLYVNGQLVAKVVTDNVPPVISAVATSDSTITGAAIAWSTDEVSDSQVDYGTTTAYGSSSPLNSSPVTSHSVLLSGLAPSTLYHYQVRSRDPAGNLTSSGDFTFTTAADTTPPSAPASLVATAANTSAYSIALGWAAATDDVGVTGYRLERCTGAECTTFTSVAAAPGTNYSDAGLAPSTSYSYRVRAVDAAGNVSAASATATASTPADTTPPTAPPSLTAAASTGAYSIALGWAAATDDVGVTGYRLER